MGVDLGIDNGLKTYHSTVDEGDRDDKAYK